MNHRLFNFLDALSAVSMIAYKVDIRATAKVASSVHVPSFLVGSRHPRRGSLFSQCAVTLS